MNNYRELMLVAGGALLLFVCGATALNTAQAKLALCSEHLRRILTMNAAYEHDHGVMPPVWVAEKPLWKFWSHYLRQYTPDDKVFCCPEDPRNELMFKDEDPLFSPKRPSSISYGMNERLFPNAVGGVREIMSRKIKHPEIFLVFGDAAIPMLRPVTLPGEPRHDGRYHYITASGAQKLYRPEELGTCTDGRWTYDKKIWNPW